MVTLKVYCRTCKKDITMIDEQNADRAFHYRPCPFCHKSNLTIKFVDGEKEVTALDYIRERGLQLKKEAADK